MKSRALPRLIYHMPPSKRLALVIPIFVAGCLRTAASPSGPHWVSSDSSMYSPVAQLHVSTEIGARSITVAIDSGTLSVPGEQMALPLPIMTSLYLTAFLATPDSTLRSITGEATTATGRPIDRRAWHAVATSDSMLVASELSYGGRSPIAPLRFSVPLPSDAPHDQPLWIVFRISGNTVELLPAETPGGPPVVRPRHGGVQVYACGDRDVFGRFDEKRSASLKRAHGLAC